MSEWLMDVPSYPCPWEPSIARYLDPGERVALEWSGAAWAYVPAKD
jgi:hypothetical protein